MVAVKGLTMPTKCAECQFYYDDFICELLANWKGMSVIEDRNARLPECPLVEIN